MSDTPTIAILGATGHIGRSLIHEFIGHGDAHILAYARRPEALEDDRNVLGKTSFQTLHIDSFASQSASIVINCTGVGDPARVRDMGADLFRLTAQMDDRVIAFLKADPARLYVNMSSGAVYGTSFAKPAQADSVISRPVNEVPETAYYGIIKRHAEARHRALAPLNIVDIRVFNHISPFLNRDGRLFIVDLVNAMLTGSVLETAPDDPVRDYTSPRLLRRLINGIVARWQVENAGVNAALDLYTQAPVAKFDLLRAVEERFGVKWLISATATVIATTGAKSLYYSKNHAAAEWGYAPDTDSLASVMEALSALMEPRA